MAGAEILFSKHPGPTLEPIQLPIQQLSGLFRGWKWLQRERDHLLPGNGEFKNVWSFPSQVIAPCGPGSVVGIATGYGQEGAGIESRWGREFPHLSRRALGPTQPLVQRVPVFPGGKERPGRDADPSPPSSAVVKKE